MSGALTSDPESLRCIDAPGPAFTLVVTFTVAMIHVPEH